MLLTISDKVPRHLEERHLAELHVIMLNVPQAQKSRTPGKIIKNVIQT
jgi:hypothetical protein